jgi:hypothetical protein
MAQFDPQGRVYWGKSPSDFPAAIWYDTSAYPNVLMKFNVGDGSYLEIATFDAGDPNGTLAVNGASVGAVSLSLNDLSNVLAATPTSGDLIAYDGSQWVATANTAASALGELSDVSTAGALANQVLTFDGTSWSAQAISQSLDNLSDVTAAGATSGQILRHNGTGWALGSSAAVVGGAQLSDLSNVTGTAPSTGDILQFDGTNWAPAADSGGGAGGLGTWSEVGSAGAAVWVNGSSYLPGSYGNVRYRKDDRGMVELAGLVTGVTTQQTVFTLPVGFRPQTEQFLSTICSAGAGSIYITSNNVTVYTAGIATNQWTSLFNLRFEAVA